MEYEMSIFAKAVMSSDTGLSSHSRAELLSLSGAKIMKHLFLLFIVSLFSTHLLSGNPDCSGVNRWATNMAYTQLKNEGLLTRESVDITKTITTRIASEQIGDDLYKQVHRVVFTLHSGGVVQVMTVNDASSEECSMSSVEVYVVSKKL